MTRMSPSQFARRRSVDRAPQTDADVRKCPRIKDDLMDHLLARYPGPLVAPGVDRDTLMFEAGASSVVAYLLMCRERQASHV